MKNLPIGIQTLVEIRAKNGVYVDKTQLVHQMVTRGKYYFLSRPRRFGKSLTISTLKELFLGNKPIFEGLWIYDKWDWSKTNPVVHFSFDAMSYHRQSLEIAISKELKYWAKEYKIRIVATDFQEQFKELLEKLSKKRGQVVLLIDEYDKPIIDYMEGADIEQAKVNRGILRDFYSVLKNADTSLKLVFITGISKFAKVSLFSHLNNLMDITLSKEYATITGYTQSELEFYFDDYLSLCASELQLSREELLYHIKKWYDGYTWDGKTEMYNPFGTLNFLFDKVFKNYWFSTGHPKFLIEQMRKYERFDVENSVVDTTLLDTYDIENMALVPLLFQTGYLTIKSIDAMTGDMILDYPNKTAKEAFDQIIDNKYANKYQVSGKTITGIGVNFNSDTREIDDWIDKPIA